jgi:hypothetical protein
MVGVRVHKELSRCLVILTMLLICALAATNKAQSQANASSQDRGSRTRLPAHAEPLTQFQAGVQRLTNRIHDLHSKGKQIQGRADDIRRELHQATSELEALLCDAPDSSSRLQLLRSVANGYFIAAYPWSTTPHDDSLRLAPGAAWEDYVRVAWQITTEIEGGLDSPGATFLLAPYVVYMDDSDLDGRVYGPAYYAQALRLYRMTHSATVRIMSGTYAVRCCMLHDWTLACSLATAIQAEQRKFTPPSAWDAKMVSLWVGDMQAAFKGMLDPVWVSLALEAAASDASFGVDTATLSNPDSLWKLVVPYLPAAVRKRSPELVTEWMDFQANRFRTTPGLQLLEVEWREDSDGRMNPHLLMKPVFRK